MKAYKVGNEFKISHLAIAKFTFTPMGEFIGFELLDVAANNMRFVTLEHGENYHWDSPVDRVFLPLKLKIQEDIFEWQTADGQSGFVESEDGDNQQDFDQVFDLLQTNFAYLRERAIRKQPVVIYPHGLPTNAYLDVIDQFFDEPFLSEDYEDYLDNSED